MSLSSIIGRSIGISSNSFFECHSNTSSIRSHEQHSLLQESSTDSSQLATPNEMKNCNDRTMAHFNRLIHLFKVFLRSNGGESESLNDDYLTSMMLQLQDIKQQQNSLYHVLPKWDRLHYSLNRIEELMKLVYISIFEITDDVDIYQFKTMLLKIVSIMQEIFDRL